MKIAECGVPVQAETGTGCSSGIPNPLYRKYECFFVTKVNEKNVVDLEHDVLALTLLKEFVIERDVKEVSIPV